MAIVVQSASSNSITSNGTSVSVTAPTGIQAGDLLYAVGVSKAGSGAEVNLPTGWTNVQNLLDTNTVSYRIMTKIATSGDAGLSSFSFTQSTSSTFGVSMLRITGHAPTILDNATTPSSLLFDGIATGTTYSVAADLTPLVPNSLLVFVAINLDAGETNVTNFNITGQTNPTWTEQTFFDLSGLRVEVATGFNSTTNNITQLSVDSTSSARMYMVLTDFTPQANATGSTSLLEESFQFFDNTAQVGTTGSLERLETAPTVFASSGRVIFDAQKTQFALENKPTSAFKLENK